MRVVIAEDSVLLREGLRSLLEDSGIVVVETADDAQGLLAAVADHLPDLALVDVRMPPSFTDEGLRAALEIRRRWPDVGLLVLSQYVEERYATDLIGAGTRDRLPAEGPGRRRRRLHRLRPQGRRRGCGDRSRGGCAAGEAASYAGHPRQTHVSRAGRSERDGGGTEQRGDRRRMWDQHRLRGEAHLVDLHEAGSDSGT